MKPLDGQGGVVEEIEEEEEELNSPLLRRFASQKAFWEATCAVAG